MTTNVTLKNSLHNTSTVIKMPMGFRADTYLKSLEFAAGNGNLAAKSKLGRIRRALCGVEGCECGIIRD